MFKANAAFKRQALTDFVADVTRNPEMEVEMEPAEPPTWNFFVDDSSGKNGTGARVVLVSPEKHKLNCAMRFDFKATNNAIEYEALLIRLRLAREMQVKRLLINNDSHLVVSQVNVNFSVKDKDMSAYLKLVLGYHPHF